MDAILGCLSNMFNIEGRTSQKDYIIFFLFVLIVSALISGTIFSIFGDSLGKWICIFLFTIPMITATARRLRDAGFSRLWALLCLFPPAGIVLEIICCLLPAK